MWGNSMLFGKKDLKLMELEAEVSRLTAANERHLEMRRHMQRQIWALQKYLGVEFVDTRTVTVKGHCVPKQPQQPEEKSDGQHAE